MSSSGFTFYFYVKLFIYKWTYKLEIEKKEKSKIESYKILIISVKNMSWMRNQNEYFLKILNKYISYLIDAMNTYRIISGKKNLLRIVRVMIIMIYSWDFILESHYIYPILRSIILMGGNF